jgi:hypothetical protein
MGGATGSTVPAYFAMNAPKIVTAYFASQGVTLSPNLSERAVLSLFVKRHESLVVSGSSPANGGLYGLPDNDVAIVNSVVNSVNQQLDQVEAQAASYADGYAYMNARNTVLQSLKSQLQSGVSTTSWQALDSHMNTFLAPAMSAVSLDDGTANACDPNATNCLIMWSEINFYNGGGANHGLGARIESWVEGPDAKHYSSTVSQVKESFTPQGSAIAQKIFTLLDMTVTGGGRAGGVNTVLNPSRGTYKIEAFHRFTRTYEDDSGTHTSVHPPFDTFFPGEQPLPPAIQYLSPVNGYDVYQTPVDLKLTIDGAQMDSSGQTATITGCSAPITITAVLTPPLPVGNTAPPITWTGGSPGSDNLHRTVPCDTGTISVTAAIGANLQAPLTINVNAPLIKLEQVGETIISQDGQYSEDTTIRVTAVNSDGQTVTTFSGTIGIMELGTDIYSQNGGYLPASVEITSGGTATFVAKSLASPYSDAAPPLEAMVTSSNFSIYGGQSLGIPQWIISGRQIDPRANANVYDWLQYRMKDIFAKYANDPDVNTVLNAIRSFDVTSRRSTRIGSSSPTWPRPWTRWWGSTAAAARPRT